MDRLSKRADPIGLAMIEATNLCPSQLSKQIAILFATLLPILFSRLETASKPAKTARISASIIEEHLQGVAKARLSGFLFRTCVFLRHPYISAAQLRLGACANGSHTEQEPSIEYNLFICITPLNNYKLITGMFSHFQKKSPSWPDNQGCEENYNQYLCFLQ